MIYVVNDLVAKNIFIELFGEYHIDDVMKIWYAHIDYITIEIEIDYYYLTSDERTQFANASSEYLIEQIQ